MNLLDSATVRSISSTQVITSVYSVVKELVENSLDASAKYILVKLENFGINRTEIQDDGVGIKKSDVALVALPHYTSKISSTDDLGRLQTYGFRGEALASLAAVSQLTLCTCTREDQFGSSYSFNCQGVIVSQRVSSIEKGTTVIVSDLFKNLPVRKQQYKSIKKCREQLKKIEELLLAFGLAHPDVRFVLRHNGAQIWQKPQKEDLKSSLPLIFSYGMSQKLSYFSYEGECDLEEEEDVAGVGEAEDAFSFTIYGYLSKPKDDLAITTRSTMDRMFLFINKRPVYVKPIMQTLKHVFHESFREVKTNRWPIGCLFIDIPTQRLDVNLEPNKTNVFIQNMDILIANMSTALSKFFVSHENSSSEGVLSSEECHFEELCDQITSQLDDTEVSFGNVEMQSQPSLQDLPATSVDKNGEDVELHERGTCSPTAESSSSDESTDLAKNNTSSSQADDPALRWSMGHVDFDQSGKTMQPVTVLNQTQSRLPLLNNHDQCSNTTSSSKRQGSPSEANLCQPKRKKHLSTGTHKLSSLKGMFQKMATLDRSLEEQYENVEELYVDVNQIVSCMKHLEQSTPETHHKGTSLIGATSTPRLWFALIDSTICASNHPISKDSDTSKLDDVFLNSHFVEVHKL